MIKRDNKISALVTTRPRGPPSVRIGERVSVRAWVMVMDSTRFKVRARVRVRLWLWLWLC